MKNEKKRGQGSLHDKGLFLVTSGRAVWDNLEDTEQTLKAKDRMRCDKGSRNRLLFWVFGSQQKKEK